MINHGAPEQLPWVKCPGCSSFSSGIVFSHIFDFFQSQKLFFKEKQQTLSCLTFLGPRTCPKLTLYAPGDPRGAERGPKGGRGVPRVRFRHPYGRLAHPIGRPTFKMTMINHGAPGQLPRVKCHGCSSFSSGFFVVAYFRHFSIAKAVVQGTTTKTNAPGQLPRGTMINHGAP